jgi:hypothetical protein
MTGAFISDRESTLETNSVNSAWRWTSLGIWVVQEERRDRAQSLPLLQCTEQHSLINRTRVSETKGRNLAEALTDQAVGQS